MTATTLEAALALHASGLCVLPAAEDGSKRPAVDWKQYQGTRPDEQQIRSWFGDGRRAGLGIVCGTVSGGLEVTELEGRAVSEGALVELTELARNSGLGDLWHSVTLGGWMVRSPSGGVHLMYRLDGEVGGNTKLAATPDHVTLAETRGQGGWIVSAPSAGPVHPSGGAWITAAGSPATMPTLTADQRRALHVLVAQLDQRPAAAPPSQFAAHSAGGEGGISPGDDYTAKTTWPQLLEPAGWRQVFTRGQVTYWRRPGKNDGISATTGYGDGDWLYVFTSSTAFQPETTYTKFGAYTVLHQSGDHAAAAKALQAEGHGKRAPEPQRPVPVVPATDGNLAVVHDLDQRRHEPRLEVVEEATLERSDDGNALLLLDRFGNVIRHCEDRGTWLAWDGHRWHWCDRTGGVVREYAKRVARSLPADDPAAVKHKRSSLSAGGTTAMLSQAATDSRASVSMAELDAHPLLLNTPGGIVDLAAGTLGPARPEQLHTRATKLAPDFEQPTPRWDAFLADTFAGHEDLVPFVHRLLGYSATGVVTHHILPFLHGPGGNGKSVFLDVARALLGDYAATAPAKFLMAGQPQHETEVARLSGLRLVICSEVNKTDRFDEAKVKILTGGDSLTARFMRADHFTFTPTHKLWLMGNHQPRVSGGGDSFWRRLRMVQFSNTIDDDKKVDGLADILVTEEGPGILAWIVRGARDVLARGLATPASVLTATSAYAREEDSLARFLADRCHIGGGAHVRTVTGELRAAYDSWCREEGEAPLNSTAFGRELRDLHGIGQARSNGRRYYLGLTVLADEAEPTNEHWSNR